MQRKLVERELTPEGPRRKPGLSARRRTVTVNLAESPLGWLHAHGHLDDRLFAAGERLHTENSYKFTAAGFTALAARGGWRVERIWASERPAFAVVLLSA